MERQDSRYRMNPLAEYQRPPGAFAFHHTNVDNVSSIRENGITTTQPIGADTSTIDEVLAELGYESPFPFDRTEVTYCYVDSEFTTDCLPSQNDSGLVSDDRAIVVAIEEIAAPMFLANMSHITDLLDYRHVGARIMIHSDTPEEAVERYQESIRAVETQEHIATGAERIEGLAELVVDGNIPPTAIVDVVE